MVQPKLGQSSSQAILESQTPEHQVVRKEIDVKLTEIIQQSIDVKDKEDIVISTNEINSFYGDIKKEKILPRHQPNANSESKSPEFKSAGDEIQIKNIKEKEEIVIFTDETNALYGGN
jgi:hypothetical protein